MELEELYENPHTRKDVLQRDYATSPFDRLIRRNILQERKVSGEWCVGFAVDVFEECVLSASVKNLGLCGLRRAREWELCLWSGHGVLLD